MFEQSHDVCGHKTILLYVSHIFQVNHVSPHETIDYKEQNRVFCTVGCLEHPLGNAVNFQIKHVLFGN